ncbi:hypothetical protein [Engelhardtia mirabilis]|uniref:Uncharacterized protein n=1 Tax=Engelhardtia mirabilis TaxID=2528011 RepID=A0A518BE74_9BACT|nr:hypothetical protein Pla133_03350 [Planctomycetes bacterium Pla133]QDU99597.1 hypothetical protein Pla86_03350 [Planctomycetes bacterium Pla86]
MTSPEHSISPELRELLGDIGQQRESVLFSLSRNDLHKVVDRPDRAGIDRTVGRFSSAERELLDGYRHEVARLITDRTVAALLDGTFESARVYAVPGDRAATLDRSQVEARAEALSTHAPDELAQCLRRFSSSAGESYTELQAQAVRLVPSGRNRYHLADVLLLSGFETSSTRILMNLVAEAPKTRMGSVAAEFAAGIAADAGATLAACHLYKTSTSFDATRSVPCVGWLFQAVKLSDQVEAESALSVLGGVGDADVDAVGQQLQWRRDARDRGEWSPSEPSRILSDRLRRGASAIAEEVFDVFV